MKSWIDEHAREVLIGALSAWALFAFLFIARSPAGAFTHDFNGHLQFTQILYKERRLPFPREGWETYQPPVYYLANTLFSPERPSHTFRIRLLSMVYGTMTLLGIVRLLRKCAVSPSTQLLVLSFIATTPAFLFMFSTYNNDSLATLMSVSLLVAAHEWILQGQKRQLICFGALAAVGLYTKLSVVFPLASLCMVLGFLGIAGRLKWERILPLWAAVVVAVLLLSPWLVLHNYRHTGFLTPTPADFPVDDRVHLPHSALRTVLTPPGISSQEWKDPYVHLWEASPTKKNSYLSYLFASSIFSEYRFEFLPGVLPWAMVMCHAILGIAALFWVRDSKMGRLALSFVVMGIVCLPSLMFRSPYASFMDFRYIAWLWLPMALLYAVSFGKRRFFRALMMSGALLQGLFWLALVGGGRWNIP